MKPLNTTIEEVLRDAIQSEIDSRAYFLALADRAASPEARNKIIELADRQMLHRARLEKRFRELVGGNLPEPKPPEVDLPADLQNVDTARALKIALERERESESNFRFLAERVPETELGAVFMELAEMEW